MKSTNTQIYSRHSTLSHNRLLDEIIKQWVQFLACENVKLDLREKKLYNQKHVLHTHCVYNLFTEASREDEAKEEQPCLV